MLMDMDDDPADKRAVSKYSSKKTEIEPRVIKGSQFGSGHAPRPYEGSVGSSNHNNYLVP
jgi:hypothetical protein